MTLFLIAGGEGGRIGNLADALPETPRRPPMKRWTKPRIDEIAVGLEINAYACAQV
jgi:coenzyme PQQ precursor peptide PqqA